MSKRYFVRIGAEVRGPLESKDVKALVKIGALSPTDYIRLGDDGRWLRAARARGLFETNEPSQNGDTAGSDSLPAKSPVATNHDRAVTPPSTQPIRDEIEIHDRQFLRSRPARLIRNGDAISIQDDGGSHSFEFTRGEIDSPDIDNRLRLVRRSLLVKQRTFWRRYLVPKNNIDLLSQWLGPKFARAQSKLRVRHEIVAFGTLMILGGLFQTIRCLSMIGGIELRIMPAFFRFEAFIGIVWGVSMVSVGITAVTVRSVAMCYWLMGMILFASAWNVIVDGIYILVSAETIAESIRTAANKSQLFVVRGSIKENLYFAGLGSLALGVGQSLVGVHLGQVARDFTRKDKEISIDSKDHS